MGGPSLAARGWRQRDGSRRAQHRAADLALIMQILALYVRVVVSAESELELELEPVVIIGKLGK